MSGDESAKCSIWTREQDKSFENGLAIYPEDLEDRWERIAADVPGKTVEEIIQHYNILIGDLSRIESGCVPLPRYDTSADDLTGQVGDEGTGRKGGNSGQYGVDGGKASRAEQERRKGISWSEEEHRLFLLGLEKYGKGDWRSISRNFVVTRTPTQVASHAQKYFIRLNSMNKDRRRSSIHDITNVNDVVVPQGTINGQTNGSSGGSSNKPSKELSQAPSLLEGVLVYGGTTIGQPVGGHLVSAIGTPVHPPQHMAFSVRAPVHGQMVPVAPMNMGAPVNTVPGSSAYPVPHSSAHR
ncbi:hypothetical protein ACET3Z_002351 [Daucus carota]